MGDRATFGAVHMLKNVTIAFLAAVAGLALQFLLDRNIHSGGPGGAASGAACGVVLVDGESGWYVNENPPVSSCEDAIAASRSFGTVRRYGRVGGSVYSLDDRSAEQGGIEMAAVEGDVALERLRPHLGGMYASDGTALFYGARRVAVVAPAIDAARLRRLDRDAEAPSGYVTDGRWVLYEHHVLVGADPASFEPIPQPPGSEKEDARFGGERQPVRFGRDAKAVYFGAQRVDSADPRSFQLIYVSNHAAADLDRGYWAFDSSSAWHLFDGTLRKHQGYEAAVLRQRLDAFRAPLSERLPLLRYLVLPACALAMLAVALSVTRLQRRIRSRYQLSLLNSAVALLATIYLVVPTLLFWLLSSVGREPSAIAVSLFFMSALGAAAFLLGIRNSDAMDRVSAVGTTAVQVAVLALVLAGGMFPSLLFYALSNRPGG